MEELAKGLRLYAVPNHRTSASPDSFSPESDFLLAIVFGDDRILCLDEDTHNEFGSVSSSFFSLMCICRSVEVMGDGRQAEQALAPYGIRCAHPAGEEQCSEQKNLRNRMLMICFCL